MSWTGLSTSKKWGELIKYTCLNARVIGSNYENLEKALVEEDKIKIKNINTNISRPEFSAILARCLVGPNFASKNEECFSVAFEILDKYGITYNREEIIANIDKILYYKSPFSDDERGEE